MARLAPPPQPSRWTRALNGDRDYIPGFDDGEPLQQSATADEPTDGPMAQKSREKMQRQEKAEGDDLGFPSDDESKWG